MRSHVLKTLRSYSIIAVITLSLIEVILQISHIQKLNSIQTIQKLFQLSSREHYAGRYCHSYGWKYDFIQYYRTNRPTILSFGGLHVSHPTRGWTTRPNVSVTIDGKQYTTNNKGQRSLKNHTNNPNQYSVLIVGDSYTFGSDTDDAEVWTNLLQGKDRRLNIINLAVGGYGIDQMYVTLNETIADYQPDLVIAAFIEDDILRMKFDFRDYQKPQLKLKNGTLHLTNVPIGNLEQTYPEISQELQSSGIPGIKIDDLFFNITLFCRADYKLFSHAIAQMQAISQQQEAEFLLVYLPSGIEVEDANHQGYGERFFERVVQENALNSLNPRQDFLRGTGYQGGHYQKPEATLVSDLVYDRIQQLSSWQNFIESKPK